MFEGGSPTTENSKMEDHDGMKQLYSYTSWLAKYSEKMDERGHSRIDYENGVYKYKNFLDGECIENRVLMPSEVREIIREIINR